MKIVAVAYRLPCGLVVSLPPPSSHRTLQERLNHLGAAVRWVEVERGFLTSRGHFRNDEEALLIARVAGQADHVPRGQTFLMDKDLWPELL